MPTPRQKPGWLASDKVKIFDALLFNVAFLLIVWTFWLIEYAEPAIQIKQFGTRPRSVEGLIGILTTPFLHGSFDHIKGNSLSFLTLSSFLIFFYREIAFRVVGWLYLVSGIVLWFIAQGGNHIGASGVIYGLASFLFVSGIVRKDPVLLRVALAVAFLYGSIVWWILPIEPGVSWEGHLAGALVGAILAVVFRKKGPQRRRYRWEIEEELEAQRENEEQALSAELGEAANGAHPSENNSSQPLYWKSDHTGDRPIRYN
ncbi:MAG: rhomboid family intramembrane serine protease [Flavobacteriales bacterium]